VAILGLTIRLRRVLYPGGEVLPSVRCRTRPVTWTLWTLAASDRKCNAAAETYVSIA
jgi:hypothetical protein